MRSDRLNWFQRAFEELERRLDRLLDEVGSPDSFDTHVIVESSVGRLLFATILNSSVGVFHLALRDISSIWSRKIGRVQLYMPSEDLAPAGLVHMILRRPQSKK